MTTTTTPDRFTTLPDDRALAATVTALEEHGFSTEVVDDLDAARQAVLARIPHGASVMTNTSVTLAETGIAEDRDAARQAVRGRIRSGASVMTNTSVTLGGNGIAEAINNGGPYDSAR